MNNSTKRFEFIRCESFKEDASKIEIDWFLLKPNSKRYYISSYSLHFSLELLGRYFGVIFRWGFKERVMNKREFTIKQSAEEFIRSLDEFDS